MQCSIEFSSVILRVASISREVLSPSRCTLDRLVEEFHQSRQTACRTLLVESAISARLPTSSLFPQREVLAPDSVSEAQDKAGKPSVLEHSSSVLSPEIE